MKLKLNFGTLVRKGGKNPSDQKKNQLKPEVRVHCIDFNQNLKKTSLLKHTRPFLIIELIYYKASVVH